MVKYVCDMCQRDVELTDVNVIAMPRNTLCYAKDVLGARLMGFDGGVEIKQTHLCNKCLKIIANLFPKIEVDS